MSRHKRSNLQTMRPPLLWCLVASLVVGAQGATAESWEPVGKPINGQSRDRQERNSINRI